MTKNQHILVTGIGGFSGTNLFHFLRKKKYPVMGISRKKKNNFILKKNLLNNLKLNDLKNKKVSTLIHTAGYHKIDEFSQLPKIKKKKNILMTKKLIKFCKEAGVKSFIFFSTIDISSNYKNKIKRDYINSKIQIEKILKKEYEKKTFDRVFILRLPAIIGKKCNENFISSTLKNLKLNKDIQLWGYKKKYNNFIHIDDINLLILKLLKFNYRKLKYINISSNGNYTLKSLILFMKNQLKSKSKIILKNPSSIQKIYFKKKDYFHFQDCKKVLKKFVYENK